MKDQIIKTIEQSLEVLNNIIVAKTYSGIRITAIIFSGFLFIAIVVILN